MAETAFQATFSDFRLIKGRKVAQIVLEVAIEAADAALETLGGVPRPDRETWVGVARLDQSRAASGHSVAVIEPPVRRRFADLPMSQQSALRCDDLQFRTFLRAHNFVVSTSDEAAEAVRNLIGVASRADILPETPAGRGWVELERKFAEWRLA